MRSSANFSLASRKGHLFKFQIRIPYAYPASGVLKELEDDVDIHTEKEGHDMIVEVKFGYKSILLIGLVISQVIYLYGSIVLRAFGLIGPVPPGVYQLHEQFLMKLIG